MNDRTSVADQAEVHQEHTATHTPDAADRAELVRIYLDDHWAGAGAGVALAERLASENETTPWQAELARIAAAIEDDQRTLARLRDRHHRPRFSLKRALAMAFERVGRLKLNGRLTGYSPLSRVLEIELLMAGVQAKLRLWGALRHCDRSMVDVDLDAMERRALDQLEQLGRIHDQAAHVALAARREPD